jgi:hypothetical protein
MFVITEREHYETPCVITQTECVYRAVRTEYLYIISLILGI